MARRPAPIIPPTLSNVFEGVSARIHYTITYDAFMALDKICKTPDGLKDFVSLKKNTAEKTLSVIIALATSRKSDYQSLAVKILSAKEAVWNLTTQGQSDRLMDLLEERVFNSAQKTKILSAERAIWGIVHDREAAQRLVVLLEGRTFSPVQLDKIVSVRNISRAFAVYGYEDRFNRLLQKAETSGEYDLPSRAHN